MDNIHYISSDVISIDTLHDIISYHKTLELSDEAKVNIVKCRSYLDKKMAENDEPIYGINTGFGSLCNVKISNELGQYLTTDQLYFDQKNSWFYTEKPFVMVDEKAGTTSGRGIDFSRDFKIINYQNVTGSINQNN